MREATGSGEAKAAPVALQDVKAGTVTVRVEPQEGQESRTFTINLEPTIEAIRASGADVVTMQETYGSGAHIAAGLGFHYYLRSSNLSVMSRFPIVDVHRLGPAFRFGGVTIELRPDGTTAPVVEVVPDF